jgi:hypothetical protein
MTGDLDWAGRIRQSYTFLTRQQYLAPRGANYIVSGITPIAGSSGCLLNLSCPDKAMRKIEISTKGGVSQPEDRRRLWRQIEECLKISDAPSFEILFKRLEDLETH